MLDNKTIDKIKADAEIYTNEFDRRSFNRDVCDAHESGATEWAGKAQQAIGTIEQIESVVSWMDDGTFKKKLSEIIAKYKEVSNG
jgi:hypothetical protein